MGDSEAELGFDCADVRFRDEFEPIPAATPSQRRALVDRVRAHVAANPSTRAGGDAAQRTMTSEGEPPSPTRT
jgi:hypothetical protein